MVTELWHQMEKSRTENTSGFIDQCQEKLLQAAYEKYDLIDTSNPNALKRRGIRVPVLMEAEEVIALAFEENNDA